MSKNSIEITEVLIFPVRNSEASRVKAFASITINGCLKINGCRLVDGAKGVFLSLPSEKKPGTETWNNIVMPTSREVSDKIQETVLARYREVLSVA